MAEADHLAPVDVDEAYDEESDEIGDSDVGEEDVAGDVADGEHAEDVAALLVDVFEVVVDVDGDEDAAAEDGDAGEEPAHHAEEAQKGDRVQADLVHELGFLGVHERGEPAEEGVADARRGLVADMVLDFRLINNLCGSEFRDGGRGICGRTLFLGRRMLNARTVTTWVAGALAAHYARSLGHSRI